MVVVIFFLILMYYFVMDLSLKNVKIKVFCGKKKGIKKFLGIEEFSEIEMNLLNVNFKSD